MAAFHRILVGLMIIYGTLQDYVESGNAAKINDNMRHNSGKKGVKLKNEVLQHQNSTKRALISEEEAKKAMQGYLNAIEGFISGAAGEIPFGAAFYTFFKSILTDLTGGDRSLWDQLRNQVNYSIDRANADIDIGEVDTAMRKIERRIREGNFTQSDYEAAIDLMEEVFPNKREAVGWHDELPLRSLYYVSMIIQVYLIRIEQGDQDKCSLGKRLVEIRQEVIYGMKEMIRKRYRQVQDKKFIRNSERPTVAFTVGNPDSTPFEASLIEGNKDPLVLSIRHGTGFNDEKYYSWNYRIKNIENKVIDFLMTEVVKKINKFFKQDICLEGCVCPKAITREEIGLEWPSRCMGQKGDERCGTLCGNFNYSYKWCYTTIKKDWIKHCTRTDIRCCIVMPYDTRPNRCDSKKKKIKKKSTKGKKKENKENSS